MRIRVLLENVWCRGEGSLVVCRKLCDLEANAGREGDSATGPAYREIEDAARVEEKRVRTRRRAS